MQTVAIIPARGGSKRIPRKNIRSFCGKPMISRSLEVAFASGVFDAVVVSTDDEETASLAESLGAQVPFRRPPELSNDHATTLPVIAHAIRWWEENRAPVGEKCLSPAHSRSAPVRSVARSAAGKCLSPVHSGAFGACPAPTESVCLRRSLQLIVNQCNPTKLRLMLLYQGFGASNNPVPDRSA